MLARGTIKEWKLLSPEKQATVAVWAANNLHPEFDNQAILDRANHSCFVLNRLADEEIASDRDTIANLVAMSEVTDFPKEASGE